MPTATTQPSSRPLADLKLPLPEPKITPSSGPIARALALSSTTVGSPTPTPNATQAQAQGLCVDEPISAIRRFLSGKRIVVPETDGPKFLFKTFRTNHRIGGRPILGLVATDALLAEVASNLKQCMPSNGFPPALKALAAEIERNLYLEHTSPSTQATTPSAASLK